MDKCRYFGKCGGCTSQHIPYAAQLEQKKTRLARAVRLLPEQISVFASKELAYRNRMDFIFHPGGLGFRERDKWFRTVDIEECSISEPRVNALLKEVRQYFAAADVFDVKKHSGTFRYAVIRTSGKEASISFVLNEDSPRLQAAIEQVKAYAETSSAENIIVTYVPAKTDMSISSEFFTVKGNDELVAEYLGKKFSYSVQGFFQNNHAMAEEMHKHVRKLLEKEDAKQSLLLDLYAGVGTFGINNADLFKQVLIIESVKECIDSANKNMKMNGIANAEARVLDARMIKKLDFPCGQFVITDPPRSGMHPDTIAHLNKLKPRKIIYISCNVDQLERDLPKFRDYVVKNAALFDLFPQTPHSEAIVELLRKASVTTML